MCELWSLLYWGNYNRHFNTRVNEHLFRDNNSTFLNISVLLKGVRISAIFLVLRLSIMPALILNLYMIYFIYTSHHLNFHIEQLKPKLNKQVEHVSLSFKIYLLLFTGSFQFTFRYFLPLSFILLPSQYKKVQQLTNI